MRYLFTLLCMLFVVGSANRLQAEITDGLADDVLPAEVQNPQVKARSGGLPAVCERIRPQVASALGLSQNSSTVTCYLKLFLKETTCRSTLSQAQGNAGNAHAGYGICSLEKSLAVRKRNKRGPNCMDISTLANQVRCCRDIMRKHGGAYFGPVARGQVPRCN